MKERTLFSVDKYEVEANTFAVELLLPDWVVSQYKNTEFTLDDIAVMNGVPAELAHLKDLSELKIFNPKTEHTFSKGRIDYHELDG